MAIKLGLESLPDCSKCHHPSKRVVGRQIDALGPGVVSPIYACDNHRCQVWGGIMMQYILRCERNRKEKEK